MSLDVDSAGCLRRPVAPSPRQSRFHALAFEIRRGPGQLRAVHVVEGVGVDNGVACTVHHARDDRDGAAARADMEIGALRAEAIAAHPRPVRDLQAEVAARVRGPYAAVLAAEAAPAGAHRYGRAGIGPVE